MILRHERRASALEAWDYRRATHFRGAMPAAGDAIEPGGARPVPREIDNAAMPAGSPMFYFCQACWGLVILAEDYLSPQALCYDCRDLVDAGWISRRHDGEWIRMVTAEGEAVCKNCTHLASKHNPSGTCRQCGQEDCWEQA